MHIIKMKKNFPLLFLALFLSCKTAPPVPDADAASYIPLEGGALAYIFADVKNARPILELLPIAEMQNKQTRQILDKTQTAVAAFYPPESGRRFQLAAQGNYPGFRAGLAFGMSKYWKKCRSDAGYSFWYSAAHKLSILLNSKQAFVTAWVDDTGGDPAAPAPGIEAPQGLAEFRNGAVLSCWLEKPGARINFALEEMGIPVQLPAQHIFISLFPAEEQKYEAIIKIRTPNANQARSLVTIISLARSFITPAAPAEDDQESADVFPVLISVLFSNPPALDGRDVNIKTSALTEKEISLLFNLFSIY
ncbi:MAG: hypothetical protein FWG99_06030 [Treponema sp.]|nr:hypothetical protein [Treponema sp.]